MLKHLFVIGLTVLTLFAAGTYSQYSWAMYNKNAYLVEVSPNARAYAPDYVWTIYTNGYINSNYAVLPAPKQDPYYEYMHVRDMYVEESKITAAKAVYVTTQTETSNGLVLYRNYVRPSDKYETVEVSYLPPIGNTPSVEGRTSTFVAPFGYKYHSVETKPVHPIRDFRADFWQNKYYRDEFHNQASYNQAYGMYNYWNSAASDESSDD